jgi:ketosteroid isomerase-like protein
MRRYCKSWNDWLIAEFKNDTATVAKMMDESFMAVGLSRIFSKQEELEGIHKTISQRMKDDHIVDSLYFEDVHIRIHGNTAIVTFISVTKGRIKDVPFANRRTRMYDVWIRRNGEWKAVSSQVTPLK